MSRKITENNMHPFSNTVKEKVFTFWDYAVRIGILISCLFCIAVYIYGQFVFESENLYANECEVFDEPWSYTDADGIVRSYHSGESIDIEKGEDVVLSMTLPDELGDGNCLFIKSSRSFEAYIDGEPRNSYDINDSVFGPNVKPIWLSITLRRTDVGKTLTVVHTDYPADVYKVSDVYFGNRLGFSMQLIHDNIYVIILSFALIILGLVVAAICIMNRIRENRQLQLWHLSLGVFSGALWLISNCYAYPLLFGNNFIDGIISYMIILLLPSAFVSYIYAVLGERYRIYHIVINILIVIVFWVLTILDFTYIAAFDKTLGLGIAVICISAAFCLGAILYDTFIKKNRNNRLIAVGFLGFVLMGIAEVIHLNVPVHHNNGAFIAIGLLFLLSCAAIREIRAIGVLRAEMREAQEANRAKSDFLANMSHEIRTPMNAVIGMAEIAMREELPQGARDCLVQIQKSGNNLLNIINDILDYSKIDSGKMEIIPEEYNLQNELNDISDILATRIGSKELELYVISDLNIPHTLLGDSMRIRQVLINLVNNAIKFTNKGSVGVTVTCEKTGADTCLLTYHIKDTGIGIKKEDLDKIFISFQQIDSKRNRSVEGTGLGLAISKRLVETMGGTMGVDSVYGEGSDFWFSIPQKILDPTVDLVLDSPEKKRVVFLNNDPVKEQIFLEEAGITGFEKIQISDIGEYSADPGYRDYVFFDERKDDDGMKDFLKTYPDVIGVAITDFYSNFKTDVPNMRKLRRPVTTSKVVRILNEEEDDTPHYESEGYSISFTAPDARILIVDDNSINITIAEGLLAPIKMNIDSALSGAEAIEKIDKNDYDIVLMDHMMPEMDGVEATRIIRAKKGSDNPVIIALSANVVEQARNLFIEAGMNDFVAKPIDIKDITAKIRKWLPAEMIKKGVAEDTASDEASDPLMEFEMIDAPRAISALGSVVLLRKIAGEYYELGEKNYNAILNAHETGNIKDFTIKVHALKSSSRQIGQYKLGDMAEALENAGRTEDKDFINENLGETMDLYRKFLEGLSVFFTDTQKDMKELTPEELNGLMKKLKDACDDLDLDAMEEVKKSLKEHILPEDKIADLDALCDAISGLDTITCEELIAKIDQ